MTRSLDSAWVIDEQPPSERPHGCNLPGRFMRWISGIRPGTVIACCGCKRRWRWTGRGWVGAGVMGKYDRCSA